jgi:hypothetical protein
MLSDVVPCLFRLKNTNCKENKTVQQITVIPFSQNKILDNMFVISLASQISQVTKQIKKNKNFMH